MAYELKPLMRQKVLYNSTNATNKLRYQLVIDGVKVTPTSATITIYRKGVSTAIVSAASMTVSGSLLTYAVVTTTTASYPIETGYRADIAVTYGGAVYARSIIFDVVKYLLDLSIGVDQLIDIDDRVAGMVHNGSDDMPGLIVAARSVLQARLESKVLGDDKLIENAILDSSQFSTAACFYILSQLWFNKGDQAKAEWYRKEFDSLSEAILGSIRYDSDQDGAEDGNIGGLTQVRLMT